MKAKAEVILENLRGLRVLDLGGSGYGEDNPYERQLREAWNVCAKRTTADYSAGADVQVDFNAFPITPIQGEYDMATAFDVLEHLEHPVDVLRWIPAPKLIVTLPNALSWIARRMEIQNKSKHLFSFVPYTASILLSEGGWRVDKLEYQFGKWSLVARMLNVIGSLYPAAVATGLILHCSRSTERAVDWQLK